MSGNNNVAHRSAENEMMDFGKISIPERTEYVSMGNYWMHVESAKFIKPTENNKEGKLKCPYLEVLFLGKSGQLTEKFYVSPAEGLMKRLQYLHFALTGKECTKAFKSVDEVGKYYETLLNDSRITQKKLAMIVAGQESANGKIYGQLPYLHFIIDTDLANKSGFEEGKWEEGSANWNNFLKKLDKNPSHETEDIILRASAQVPDVSDDLPF